jgi:hypothetical protein
MQIFGHCGEQNKKLVVLLLELMEIRRLELSRLKAAMRSLAKRTQGQKINTFRPCDQKKNSAY